MDAKAEDKTLNRLHWLFWDPMHSSNQFLAVVGILTVGLRANNDTAKTLHGLYSQVKAQNSNNFSGGLINQTFLQSMIKK